MRAEPNGQSEAATAATVHVGRPWRTCCPTEYGGAHTPACSGQAAAPGYVDCDACQDSHPIGIHNAAQAIASLPKCQVSVVNDGNLIKCELHADHHPDDHSAARGAITWAINPPTVHEALLSMMQDVRAVGKDGRYDQGGTRYNFRGVDAVINAVGPAARTHGIIPTITAIDRSYTEGSTKSGGKMQECTVLVTWRLHGPAGDFRDVVSAGQAMDTSDKATSKALSVARRNMWLDTLLIPTEDRDPDADHIERGEVYRSAQSYRDELLAAGTSPGRLRQIGAELRAAGRFGEVCMDVDGETETTLGALGKRVAEEREKT